MIKLALHPFRVRLWGIHYLGLRPSGSPQAVLFAPLQGARKALRICTVEAISIWWMSFCWRKRRTVMNNKVCVIEFRELETEIGQNMDELEKMLREQG